MIDPYHLVRFRINLQINNSKVMPTLYYTDYFNADLTQQRILISLLNKQVALQQIDRKHAPLTLVDGKVILYEANAISMHLANESTIFGCNFDDEVQVYSWMQYYNRELCLLIVQIEGQILGKLQKNEKKYNYATEQLKTALKVLDNKLKMRSFFVGNSVTFVDILLCCQLDRLFRLIICEEMRKNIVHLIRWYSYVRNLKPFVDCIGEMVLCEEQFKMEFDIPDLPEDSICHSKNEENTVEIITEESHFLLDKFKRSFQSSEDKVLIINGLFQNFPSEWQIWKINYGIDEIEKKIENKNEKMESNSFGWIDSLRKCGFGSLVVQRSSQNQQYKVTGVMMQSGNQIIEQWKKLSSFANHEFTALDPKIIEHQQLIKNSWLSNNRQEGFELNISFRLI